MSMKSMHSTNFDMKYNCVSKDVWQRWYTKSEIFLKRMSLTASNNDKCNESIYWVYKYVSARLEDMWRIQYLNSRFTQVLRISKSYILTSSTAIQSDKCEPCSESSPLDLSFLSLYNISCWVFMTLFYWLNIQDLVTWRRSYRSWLLGLPGDLSDLGRCRWQNCKTNDFVFMIK